jgi:hypothetical protein
MSGSVARTVGIRVSTEGADRARRELEQFGTAGEAALRLRAPIMPDVVQLFGHLSSA